LPLAIYRFPKHVIVPRILPSSRLRCVAPVSLHCQHVAVSINSEQKVDLSGWSSLRELFVLTPFFNNVILIIKPFNLKGGGHKWLINKDLEGDFVV